MTDAEASGRKREDREKVADHLLEEGRMVLPGIQALFGFQLIAVFNQGFQELPRLERLMHFVAVVLIACCMVLVLAPAAYHRQGEPRVISDGFLRWAGYSLVFAMAPLALGLCLDLDVVGYAILDRRDIAALVAGAVLLSCVALWFVLPAWRRWQRRHIEREQIHGV